MRIEKFFEQYKFASVVFDPAPSYRGEWSFSINNLLRNAKKENGLNLFQEFYKKTYQQPLEAIFKTPKILDFQVGMVSTTNLNNIGRCLRYSKIDFFIELTSFLNHNIDKYGKSDDQQEAYLRGLICHIHDDNDTLNMVYSEALKEKNKKLKNLMDNEINSEYFDVAMLDYAPYKGFMDFSSYIKSIYKITTDFQKGMLGLGDFFEQDIDYNALYETFEPDVFYLLFAKIIYEFNITKEQETGSLDNSYVYLHYYNSAIKESEENSQLYFTLSNCKKEKYSTKQFKREFEELLARHPETNNFELINFQEDDINKHKDISLMEKIGELFKGNSSANWERLSKEDLIKKGNDFTTKNNLVRETNMRINILENSDLVGKPLKGLNHFKDYYAFIYPNCQVVLEKFWENGDVSKPAVNSATFILNIDGLVEMNKTIETSLVEHSKLVPIEGLKRIFHTTINNWQRNLYNKINGSYRVEDALEFVVGLKSESSSNDYNIYTRLLEFISKERESFEMLISADNTLGLNVTSEDVINYLEFNTGYGLNSPIIGNIIITEGDILSILKIIHDIMNYEGEYILYVNEDNIGTIAYLISRANIVYKELKLNINVKIDYSENYNNYLNELVTIIGSKDFINTTAIDFSNSNKIIV